MDCANCKEPMITAELENVEIDFCSGCGGIWLDAGELETLLADEVKSRQLSTSFVPAPHCPEKLRKCPICRKTMEKVFAGPTDKVVLLDRCRAGHGLWFDRGELQQVIKYGTLDKQGQVLRILNEMFGDTNNESRT
jgi:Zn-finger nucleic acid-binding protein